MLQTHEKGFPSGPLPAATYVVKKGPHIFNVDNLKLSQFLDLLSRVVDLSIIEPNDRLLFFLIFFTFILTEICLNHTLHAVEVCVAFGMMDGGV